MLFSRAGETHIPRPPTLHQCAERTELLTRCQAFGNKDREGIQNVQKEDTIYKRHSFPFSKSVVLSLNTGVNIILGRTGIIKSQTYCYELSRGGCNEGLMFLLCVSVVSTAPPTPLQTSGYWVLFIFFILMFWVAPAGQALGVGVGSTESRTVVLPPGAQWKGNKKTGNWIQREK